MTLDADKIKEHKRKNDVVVEVEKTFTIYIKGKKTTLTEADAKLIYERLEEELGDKFDW